MITREDFENLLAIETKARDYYNDLLKKVHDEQVIKNITEIRDDEINHMQMAQRLIDLISR